jgi:hypothetical protein
MGRHENKKLDEIGKALVKADALSALDLDRIAGDPRLFVSVLQRIEADHSKPKTRRMFRPVAAMASVALVSIAALAFVVMKNEPGVVSRRVTSSPIQETVKNPGIKQFGEPDRVVDSKLPPVETPVSVERISNRPAVVRSTRPRQPVAQQTSHEGEFYALSFAGDPNEAERGGRIVRVDIPRSTLFAMGVDIPLENEAETVKADLLVGNDGVTRAIRVVK